MKSKHKDNPAAKPLCRKRKGLACSVSDRKATVVRKSRSRDRISMRPQWWPAARGSRTFFRGQIGKGVGWNQETSYGVLLEKAGLGGREEPRKCAEEHRCETRGRPFQWLGAGH